MKYSIFLLLTISVAIVSCDKEDDNDLERFLSLKNQQVSELTGQWEWENSHGGWGGTFLTPETEGYTKLITFDNNRMFREYIDSTLTLETYYRIDTAVSTANGARYSIHYFGGKKEQEFVFDTLYNKPCIVLYDQNCRDCIGTHVYSRK